MTEALILKAKVKVLYTPENYKILPNLFHLQLSQVPISKNRPNLCVSHSPSIYLSIVAFLTVTATHFTSWMHHARQASESEK